MQSESDIIHHLHRVKSAKKIQKVITFTMAMRSAVLRISIYDPDSFQEALHQ